MNHRQSGHAGLLEADGSAGGTARLFDLAVRRQAGGRDDLPILTFTRR